MRAVVLNGAENGDKALHDVSQVIASELEDMDWEVETFMLRDTEIASCRGCFGCWIRTPGICVIDDAGRDVARAVVRSDLAVYLTPVTFGGYSSELKKAVDRLIPNVSPFFTKIDGEIHHKPRYERYPRLIGVGVLPHRDEESERLFKTLVTRNAVNMHAPAHTAGVILSSQRPEQVREEVKALFAEVEVEK